MNYLDRDINKLRQYINDLGLNLSKKKYNKFTGEAGYNGSTIFLFTDSKTSKSSIIMSLLHEVGHHLDYINRKSNKREEDKAFYSLNEGKMVGSRPDLTKKERSVIFKVERAGIKYMSKVHKLLRLEIPLYKVKYQQEFDLFQYKFLYQHGKFATVEECNKVMTKKLKFYKRKYGN